MHKKRLQRFSGEEDSKLREILLTMKKVSWAEVAKQMVALGFAARTEKSIRNRHLRLKRACLDSSDLCLNTCRRCGKKQRGHSCTNKI